jgi:hypothetical protein
MVSQGVSVVPLCDDFEDVPSYVFFEKVLQGNDVEWKSWPPDLQGWVNYRKHICIQEAWILGW